MQINRLKPIAAALTVSVALAACADTFYDRRDAVHLTTGNANASNIAVQTYDPWPRYAANRDILTNGEKIQPAIQRYKEGKVTPPRGLGTSSIEISTSPGSGENK
jgi:hypothetical protein